MKEERKRGKNKGLISSRTTALQRVFHWLDNRFPISSWPAFGHTRDISVSIAVTYLSICMALHVNPQIFTLYFVKDVFLEDDYIYEIYYFIILNISSFDPIHFWNWILSSFQNSRFSVLFLTHLFPYQYRQRYLITLFFFFLASS